jgi:hypothetical protein
MINININPQGYGNQMGSPFGSGFGQGNGMGMGCGMGMGGGMDPMLRQMSELMLGMADQFLQQQSGCCKGRGRGMSKSFRDAFNDNKEKDEVSIKQNKGKKGKKVPPDVEFKGDARNLPAILRAANSGGGK